MLRHGRRGTIPALAGTTCARGKARGGNADDPRAGGDDNHGSAAYRAASGRSPRWRGRRPVLLSWWDVAGTIPALAGTTCLAPPFRSCLVDDPRAGGDDSLSGGYDGEHDGRSPRWRGRPTRGSPWRPWLGTIPALAGTTFGHGDGDLQRADDPRAGGDDVSTPAVLIRYSGRSPRWRGRRPWSLSGGATLWTIPALAGTTTLTRSQSPVCADDPRAGGDDEVPLSNEGRRIGRSPRWRGRPGSPSRRVGGRWTIPALAGTTKSRHRSTRTREDDPRAGGDDSHR